jgi:hypothetical protein
MGADQQWSFGFQVLDDTEPTEAEQKQGARRVLTKLDTFEVSPVWIAAGLGTRTLAVKQADGDAGTVGDGSEKSGEDQDGECDAHLADTPAPDAAEAKAAEDALLEAQRKHAAEIQAKAREEFERFQRTKNKRA